MKTIETPEAPATNRQSPLSEFVVLEKQRRNLEDELKRVKARAAEIEAVILEEWAELGQQNATVDGLCAYVAHDFYCAKRGGVDTQAACQALIDNGLGGLVSPAYVAASVRSWIREQLEEGTEIPPALAELFLYGERARLRTRLV